MRVLYFVSISYFIKRYRILYYLISYYTIN